MNTQDQISFLRDALEAYLMAGHKKARRLASIKAEEALATIEAAPERCDKGHVFSDGKCVVCDAPVASGQDAYSLAYEMAIHIQSTPKFHEAGNWRALSGYIYDHLRNAVPAPNDYRQWADRLGYEITALAEANPKEQMPKIIADQIMIYFNRIEAAPVASPTIVDWLLLKEALDDYKKCADVEIVDEKIAANGLNAYERLYAHACKTASPVPHDAVVPDDGKWTEAEINDAKQRAEVLAAYFEGCEIGKSAVVPSGWQLVPALGSPEIFEEMTLARADKEITKIRFWKRLLAASPPATLETASAVRDRAFEEAAKACDDNGWARSDTGAKASNVIRALKVKP